MYVKDCTMNQNTQQNFLINMEDFLEVEESNMMEENIETPSEPTIKKPRNKPKVLKEWCEQDIYKLIQSVETEKCLWDASDEAYHNKSLRDCAWRRIKEVLNHKYSTAELNAKWTNLRIQFRGCAYRTKSKSGQGATETPKWRFYGAMSFIGRAEEQQTQPTISNMSDVEDENICSLNVPPKPLQPVTVPSPKQRKQQSGIANIAAAQIAETMREAVNVMKDRKEINPDPNVSFSHYLVSELKTLNKESAATVRKRLSIFFQECLEDERMKESNNNFV